MAVGRDARGFTTFTQENVADKIVYLSNSLGDPTYDGTQPAHTTGIHGPVKTLAAAKALMLALNGTASWLLLKDNDTWPDEVFGFWSNTTGRSATEPMVIGSYTTTTPGVVNPPDVGARPMIKSAGGDALGTILFFQGAATDGSFMALIGIEFYCYKRNPADAGHDYTYYTQTCAAFSHVCPFDTFIMEDCKFSFYTAGPSFNVNASPQTRSKGLSVRRNVSCDHYAGNVGTHSQGLYFDYTDNAVIEENLIDNNGWNATLSAHQPVTISIASPGVVTWTGHPFVAGQVYSSRIRFFTTGALPTGLLDSNSALNLYFVKTVLDVNTFTVSATDGGAAIVTTGTQSGTQSAQMYDASPDQFNHGIYAGADDTPLPLPTNMTVSGNILSRNSSHGAQIRGGGTVFNNCFCNNADAMNIFTQRSYVGWNVVTEAKDIEPLMPLCRGIEIDEGADGSLVEHNIVANASVGSTSFAFGLLAIPPPAAVGVTMNSNIVYAHGTGAWTFGSASSLAQAFYDQGTTTGGSGNSVTAGGGGSFLDPTRTVARYSAEICGLAGTIDAFMVEAKKFSNFSKQHRNLLFTADGYNNWAREGFGAQMKRLRPGQFHG